MTAPDLTTRLAEVVSAHMYAGRARNLGQYRTESTCECGAAILYGSNQGDLSYTDAIAAHQAAQLAAVVKDAQAEIWDDGARVALESEGYTHTDHAEVFNDNPYRSNDE